VRLERGVFQLEALLLEGLRAEPFFKAQGFGLGVSVVSDLTQFAGSGLGSVGIPLFVASARSAGRSG
jgi:hypothetical protein